VAKQTRFHGRHCGGRALGHVTVAELTLDIVLRHVDRMRECDRLGRGVAEAEWGVGEPGDEQDYNDEAHDYSRYPTGNHQGQHFSTWHHLVSCSVHHFFVFFRSFMKRDSP
jgi:hypothetical protein